MFTQGLTQGVWILLGIMIGTVINIVVNWYQEKRKRERLIKGTIDELKVHQERLNEFLRFLDGRCPIVS